MFNDLYRKPIEVVRRERIDKLFEHHLRMPSVNDAYIDQELQLLGTSLTAETNSYWQSRVRQEEEMKRLDKLVKKNKKSRTLNKKLLEKTK